MIPAAASWLPTTSLGPVASYQSYPSATVGADGRARLWSVATQRPIGSAFKLYVLGALAQAVSEIRVDAPVFFFEGDSERQNFALGQIFEVSCHATSLLFLALVSTTGIKTVLTVSIPSKYFPESRRAAQPLLPQRARYSLPTSHSLSVTR